MARTRNQRGMGPLLKEMRTNPVAALVNGVLGVGGILGVGLLIALRAIRYVKRTAPESARQATSEKALLFYVGLGAIFLLVGIGCLQFALLQITTRLRVFARGMVWRCFGRKRIVSWVEVAQFGPGDAAAESLTSWRMVLHNGALIVFHSGLYNRSEFAETMELIAEQIEEVRKQYG